MQKLVDMAAQKGGGAAVAPIPWHVMTSEATDAQTEQFFRDNNYFGLPPSSVRFFEQGLYPALLDDGRIAMAARGRITMSPNGNGGIYEAVARTGVLAELKRTGEPAQGPHGHQCVPRLTTAVAFAQVWSLSLSMEWTTLRFASAIRRSSGC